MALQSDYTAGAITLTSGSTDFTTTGAALETAGIRAGDEIKLPATGLTLTIASITGQNSGTLTDACPANAAGADQGYRIRFQSDLSRVAAYTQELIQLLGAGNNEAFAELDGTGGNLLPYFTGIAELATTPLTAAARALLDDADAAAMLVTLGAQAALGYTPVNKAGDVLGGQMSFDNGTDDTPELKFNDPVNGTWAYIDLSSELVRIVTSYRGNTPFVPFTIDPNSLKGSFAYGLDVGFTLDVTGTLTAAAKNFVIDDPVDPLNRDLVHATVEAPEHWVRYGGKVRLAAGSATVDIDATHRMDAGTFASFTRAATVTCLQNLEGFARLKPGPIVGGTFEIICEDEACTDEVAWEVRAERCDPFVMQDTSTDDDGYLIVQPMKPDFEEQAQ